MRENTVKFFELVAEAHHRSEEVDMFDLHSEDEASAAKWKMLRAGQEKAAFELIRHCQENGNDMIRDMDLNS